MTLVADFFQQRLEFGDFFGMPGGEVVSLANVVLEIVEFHKDGTSPRGLTQVHFLPIDKLGHCSAKTFRSPRGRPPVIRRTCDDRRLLGF